MGRRAICIRLAVMWFAVVVCVPAADATDRPPIIDVHLHARNRDWTNGEGPPNPVTGKPSSAYSGADLLQETLKQMDRYNIVRAVACHDDPDVVQRWLDAAPGRFIGGAEVPGGFGPVVTLQDIGRLRQLFGAGRFGVLGEMSPVYQGLPPTAPVLAPYFALAEELDVPVGFHAGISFPGIAYHPCCPNFRARYGDPLLLEDVLAHHPKLRIWLMHAGYPFLDNTIALMKLYPQVYADVAAIIWIESEAHVDAYLKALIDAGLGKRIMFGTDQMEWPEAIGMAVERIENAKYLTPTQKRDVFYNNAVRFFRLDIEQAHDTPSRGKGN